MEQKYTHANKAESYNLGRPKYPNAFFDYLYGEFGLSDKAVILDAGAGTGKVAKEFLERGNTVYAVEPDKDMMIILRDTLYSYDNLIPIEKTAEKTGVSSNSIDFIFCGNSYMWFDRINVIPEFQRITRNNNNQNIIIARLGPKDDIYTEELIEINNKYSISKTIIEPNNTPPFTSSMLNDKTFDFVYSQTLNEFLYGCLSASFAPNPRDYLFDDYCKSLTNLFNKYNVDGKLSGNFSLYCIIGNVKNLVI